MGWLIKSFLERAWSKIFTEKEGQISWLQPASPFYYSNEWFRSSKWFNLLLILLFRWIREIGCPHINPQFQRMPDKLMVLHVYWSRGIDKDAQRGPLQNLAAILENERRVQLQGRNGSADKVNFLCPWTALSDSAVLMFRVPFSITTAVIWYCLRVCKKNGEAILQSPFF